ncbi:MAG: 5'-deoxynucleotidase [Clostridiales bacterium]|nr:5'-deoxynucleotidase [Clostridiales bacterium]
MSYNFYAFMDRMKYIKRWVLMHSYREENIMEHSQQVTMLAHALAIIKNKIYGGSVNVERVVLYSMYHECAEVLTGDLPTPVKYLNASINVAYKDIEEKACDKLLTMLPEEIASELTPYVKPDTNSEEYKIAKAADRLAAFVKCLEEKKSGNTEFLKAEKSIEKDLLSRNMPEVNYFFEHFIKGYMLTLDELNCGIED